ncbi:MAG: butyrate kinase [Candidatus Shapirobacteria bacterium]|nr:butyrate kinase [Candidatus Shapirobacteria bacterium]
MKILVINPGSTTTKIAFFEDKNIVFEHKIDHAQDSEFQDKYCKPGNVLDQLDYRLNQIKKILEDNKIFQIDAVVGRGGMLPPITSGTYIVNDKMVDDLLHRPLANHASNLGAALALSIAKTFNISDHAYITDPVTTDEIEPKHKITGIAEIKRYAAWHALNQKAVSREYALNINKKYEELNLIVAHLGGGASFGAHKKGKTVNVVNTLSGEGPFTPERAGAIPAQDLISLCFSKKYTQDQLNYLIAGGGGLFNLLKTKNVYELRQNYETLPLETKDILDEMITGFSRSICQLIPDFEGEKIDQIIITGGIAQWPLITDKIKNDLKNLNIGVTIIPGEKELEALRDGALRVLTGQEEPKVY